MASGLSFLLELRRRKVFRGIGYYLVGAWTLLQVGEVIAEPAGMPTWTLTALLYLAVVGFPLAVWLAWRYQLTDEGLVRTVAPTDEEVQADYSLKTSDYLIFGAMLAIIGFVAWQGVSNIRQEAVETEAIAEQAAEIEREAVENSVAVLPFIDLSPGADNAYLADGLAETVLHVLSQVNGLTVSARTSSFAYRDRGMTISEMAGELGVAHVLEGSVQRANDQMRVIARLVEAGTARELWSGHFDREVNEIFAVQDEIAREVVVALQGVVLEDDLERIGDGYQPDLRAYEQYVLGLREMDVGTTESLSSARLRFEKAIEIDPGYALAYVALARNHRHETINSGAGFNEMRELVEPLVNKAMDLDPTLAEAWVMHSGLLAEDKEFEKSYQAIQKALELNPNSPDAWSGYWNYLLLNNDPEEALRAIRKATELDPESSRLQSSLAMQLFNLSRAEEAIYVLKENVRRHPDSAHVYTTLARYLTQVGQPGEAMWYLQAMYRRDPKSDSLLRDICMQWWHLWDLPRESACLEEYLERVPQDKDAQKWAAWIDRDWQEWVRIATLEVQERPNLWYPKMQLADGLAHVGEWNRIIELVEGAFPELTGPDPEISDFSQWPARRLAEAFWNSGDYAQANRLIDATLVWFDRSRKLQAGGWMAGTEDALLYALRGENDRALDTLDRAVTRGWSFYSKAVLEDTIFNDLRNDARFIEIEARLEANLARERDWYERNRDRLEL